MGTVPLEQRERLELCDLLLELGPAAPTLCAGWTTADLAAHLVVRERRPLAGPGIIRPEGRAGNLTRRAMGRELEASYEAVVGRIRSGPPLIPWRLPRLGPLLNLNEYFVHHEDVRRADGRARREDRPDLDEALWSLLRRGAKLTTRSLRPHGLVLRRPDGRDLQVRSGATTVAIVGEPSEIVLYLTGRRDAATVTLSGDGPAVEALVAARLGI